MIRKHNEYNSSGLLLFLQGGPNVYSTKILYTECGASSHHPFYEGKTYLIMGKLIYLIFHYMDYLYCIKYFSKLIHEVLLCKIQISVYHWWKNGVSQGTYIWPLPPLSYAKIEWGIKRNIYAPPPFIRENRMRFHK